MQVTHQADHLTHAVINAGEQLGFGVSDDPMFFQMLYSSLYSNPIRAAIREPLCNAWDANIDNGKRDVPLEVTLTETSLTIKDSGKGIPHDKIQQIYLILGKSTKVQQSDQTGGFGLGCKAPFAYAEHFEVRSSVDGVCTIYRMIKVSPEHGGRPAATVITSFPTKETGLSVTIPFVIHGTKSDGKPYSNDYTRIKGYLLEAIAQGGILANVNGVLVPTIPLDHTPGSWVLGESMGLRTSNGDRVFVRYGSVVYPVRGLEGLRYYREVEEALRNNISNYAEIVFQAPPDSIVIPPNRESISQHEKTVETLENLFLPFLESLAKSDKKIPKQEFANVLKNIDENQTFTMKFMLNASIKDYMTTSSLTFNNGHGLKDGIVITNTDDIVRVGIGKRDAPFGIAGMIQLYRKINKSMADRGFISHYLAKKLNHRDMTKISYWHDRTEWLDKFLVLPLVKRMMRYNLNPENLYVYNEWYGTGYTDFLRPWHNCGTYSLESVRLACRKIIIMSYSKVAVHNKDMTEKGPLTNADGGYCGAFVYLCPKTKGAADHARALFSKMRDYTFIDHTVAQDIENEAIRQKKSQEAAARRAKIAADKAAGIVPPAKVVKNKEGFANLLNMCDYNMRKINYRAYKASGDTRVNKPLFYLEKPELPPSQRANTLDMYRIGIRDSFMLVKEYGHWGFIPLTTKHRKYIEDNQLPDFAEFMVRQMERAFAHPQNIQLSIGLSLDAVRKDLTGGELGNLAYFKRELYDLVISDQWLREKLGIKFPRETHHIKNNIQLLGTMLSCGYFKDDHLERLRAIHRLVVTPVVQQATRDLFVLVRKNQSGQFVNYKVLGSKLHHCDKGVRMVARKLILQILNSK